MASNKNLLHYLNDPLRITILTILPDSWSIRKIGEEFGASLRIVRKAKELKRAEGVLAMPELKEGKKMSSDTINKVLQFYENDENNRIMPNKKDCVTVNTILMDIRKKNKND